MYKAPYLMIKYIIYIKKWLEGLVIVDEPYVFGDIAYSH